MSSKEGMNQTEVRKYLPAFADGELDVEQNLRVLEAMAMDAKHTRRVLHQQQLRRACARVMDRPDCRCPDELREKLQSLASSENDAPASPNLTLTGGEAKTDDRRPRAAADARPDVIGRIGRWLPAAVAAVLLIGALAVFFSPRPGGGPAFGLDETRLAAFAGRHTSCSSDLSKLYAGIESPDNVTALPGTIDDYFVSELGAQQSGRIDTTLDLSVLGYEFQRVGRCNLPGRNAVHIVYRAADDAEHDKSLSLWIKPATGELNLVPRTLYTAEASDGQPLLIWQRNGRTYYLLGDAPTDARHAAEVLATGNP